MFGELHKNIEIVVVNDYSKDSRYYARRPPDIISRNIDLPQNTKTQFGYPCPGYVRNQGIAVATGAYLAFLDDDDTWFPDKIRQQLMAMSAQNAMIALHRSAHG